MTITKMLTVCLVLLLSAIYFGCKRELTDAPADASFESASLTDLAKAKKGPLSVVYVEVNGNNIFNAGCYTLKNSGKQLFDVAIIFAANINYDATKKKAIEYNNPQVSTVLHGVGISNFTSRAAAHDLPSS